jgi:hypothetical protein
MAQESITTTSIYMIPGQQIHIKVPISGRETSGFFVKLGDNPPQGYFEDRPSASKMIRGFVVENEKTGTIKESDQEEAAVIYTHSAPYRNSIWFFSQTGEVGLLNIIAVPIHDHSTITHGGPAYGTYFDDDIER